MVGHDAATRVVKPGGSLVGAWCLVAQIEARHSCALRAASAAKLKIVQKNVRRAEPLLERAEEKIL